jgi:hypothetical protein
VRARMRAVFPQQYAYARARGSETMFDPHVRAGTAVVGRTAMIASPSIARMIFEAAFRQGARNRAAAWRSLAAFAVKARRWPVDRLAREWISAGVRAERRLDDDMARMKVAALGEELERRGLSKTDVLFDWLSGRFKGSRGETADQALYSDTARPAESFGATLIRAHVEGRLSEAPCRIQ